MALMEAEFPRTTAREILSSSHEVSLLFPVRAVMRLPSLCKKTFEEGPKTPVVSTATGSKVYLSESAEYLSLFLCSLAVAAEPGSIAARTTWLLQKVSVQVASHTRHFPWK